MPHDDQPSSTWAEILRAWPVLALIITGFVVGLIRWGEANSAISVIERRQIDVERRIASLETSDLSVAGVMAETRMTLAEVRTELRLLRDEVHRLAGRRAEATP